jgi:hypothetical protein
MHSPLPSSRALALAGLTVAVALAACGNATSTAAPTPAATRAPATAAPGATPSPTPNLGVHGHDAPDLEAVLPSTFRSQQLERDSLVGNNALGEGSSNPMITAWLAAHGRSVDDFAVAQANDPSGTEDVTFIVFRVRGANASELLQTIVDSTRAYDTDLVVSQATVGGHAVTKATTATRTRYLWTKDDMVFGVSSGHPEIAEEAVTAAF